MALQFVLGPFCTFISSNEIRAGVPSGVQTVLFVSTNITIHSLEDFKILCLRWLLRIYISSVENWKGRNQMALLYLKCIDSIGGSRERESVWFKYNSGLEGCGLLAGYCRWQNIVHNIWETLNWRAFSFYVSQYFMFHGKPIAQCLRLFLFSCVSLIIQWPSFNSRFGLFR